MAAGETVGGAFLSAFLQVLFDRVVSKDFLNLFKGRKLIEELVQRFRTKFQSANVLLKDAEEKQLRDEGVRNWLHSMKEVIFRADELTDYIDYEILRRKLEGPSMRSNLLAMLYNYVEVEMGRILADLELLLLQKGGVDALSPISHDTHLVREDELCGRVVDDKEAIMKLMLPAPAAAAAGGGRRRRRRRGRAGAGAGAGDCGVKVPVLIPIVGMDGIGKTTLARLVFDDQRVKNHFEIRVWVRVSTECAVLNITKRIFEEVNPKAFGNTELSLLQGELEEALKTKKFLFVLDDVWNEDLRFWDQLRPLFTFGASGSKIIITSSSRTVAERAVKNNGEEIYHLRVLEDSICWDFFNRHAFENEDLNSHPDLRESCKEIVQKCQGLPLAVKCVSDYLGSISREERRTILENKTWEWQFQKITRQVILPALWFSYGYLSPELKRCFAYCSIFPKDHEFLKEDVILLWMAEGLLKSEGGATMEDVGEVYFKNLTSRSFFQPVESKSSFTMHGFMHDLATFVLGDFGFRLEENNSGCLQSRARHLSIMRKYIRKLKQFEGVFDAKFLRTFLALKFNGSSENQHEVPLQQLLTEEEWLRVVSVSHYLSITELPASVGKLKHLRYLDLSCTAISEIPSEIRYLYNLETLLLKCCRNLTRLPAGIGGLIKLRHMDFDSSPVKDFSLQICNLKDLQTLTGFIVCKEDGGSRIKELGDLQHLRGKFDIWGLENVDDVGNVTAAKLRDKKFHMLGLYWDRSADSSDPGQHRLVLDQLQPHRNLEELRISGYDGTSFSDWMGYQSFSNIVKVELVECGNCDSLSPIEQLPSLKELWINGWPVKNLSSEFNSNGSSMTEPFKHLEALYFLNMLNLEKWSITPGAVFPCLKQLRFDMCPKLDLELPDCFPALTVLVVSCCKQLRPLLNQGSTHQGRGFSSLEKLYIFACPKQRDFSNGELPSSLKEIRIINT